MSTVIQQIEDADGKSVLPVTNTKAVYDDNNNRLDNVLATVPRCSNAVTSTSAVARDADTLAGNQPAYYATAASVSTLSDSLNSFRHLNYIDKVYASITLNANGYFKFAATPEGLPTGIGTIVMANVYNWGLVSSKDAINVTPIYVMGTANATIANLVVRFWYV